ncbi:autoinducer binding domain-containing protein [Neorhizobium sp. T786]|uniref:LuxR C-terminal-related transcriptional regulator n=1 Tax=Pseudorhizobium xiangyangii TaxID=2883104 RepID=UPI001CFFB083|nr:LuxR C-terminal-related transcriptional regulator [Neorhizobium xiangyangii]MCB5201288.1 autoinducer binding domain-containing protein [Neorhizobium xiangyangii]
MKMEEPERQSALSEVIAAAGCQADVVAALERAARAFEFSYVSLLVKPTGIEHLLSRILVRSTLPADFVQEFDRNRFLVEFPILPTLFESMLPRAWTLDSLQSDFGKEHPTPVMHLLRRFGITTTIVMPLHSLDGERFLMCFDGDRPPLQQAEINELGMISLHAFDVFEKIRRTGRLAVPNPLSGRELEVVRWTAQGKTSVEIGHILSLSDHTVNAHMTNAIKKLDCVNRTQLVAKAIRLGLIP